MTDIEFIPWPKIHRLRRNITVTEKVDGTNACIIITDDGLVAAQSRKRLITPESDNFGFAAWVAEHREELLELGPGRHYGEWYGLGIQRGYGLTEKRFALFNANRWRDATLPSQIEVVPTLYQGPFSDGAIEDCLEDLRVSGSRIAQGFDNPEGIVVYMDAARTSYKVLIENDEIPKGALVA